MRLIVAIAAGVVDAIDTMSDRIGRRNHRVRPRPPIVALRLDKEPVFLPTYGCGRESQSLKYFFLMSCARRSSAGNRSPEAPSATLPSSKLRVTDASMAM